MARSHFLDPLRSASEPSPLVVRHHSELGSWESVEREPSSHLRRYIDGPYQGWVENTNGVLRRREIPASIIPIILNLGPPYGIVDPKVPSERPRLVGSFVAGLHDTFAETESNGYHTCVQVNLTPIGGHLFFGVAMHTLAHRVVELGDILGPPARRLEDAMAEASDWERRFDVLEAFISDRIFSARAASPGVVWALEILNKSAGLSNISTLATELGWSHKHLIAKFHEQIGLPPKTVARVLRFHRAIDLLQQRDIPRWVEIAQICGYYDQAHLIRDFRQFAGSTPSEYLGRRLPDGGGLKGD
jgi:AraC-like DNA-binding protein